MSDQRGLSGRARAGLVIAAVAIIVVAYLLISSGGDDDKSESSGKPTQDPDVSFTGDPITVMTISTYDTDYLLVRADTLDSTIDVLRVAGYEIEPGHDHESSYGPWPG